MTYLDTAVLDVTELCCRAFQRATGKTNVWLAVQLTNLSVIVYFAWAGLYSWMVGPADGAILGVFCVVVLVVLSRTVFRVPIEASERAAYARVAKGFRNPRRVRDLLLRVPFLTLSILLGYPAYFLYVNLRMPIVILSYLLVVLTTAILYLLACDPLPPCTGKVREWLRALAAFRLSPEGSQARPERPDVRRGRASKRIAS